MDKKEEFKEFIYKHEELVDYIKRKEMTMQEFYELYDVYGSDSNVWDKYFNKQPKISDIKSIINKINVENIEHHVDNAQKVINVIQEISKKTPEIKNIVEKPITKFFGD